jgi:hypothetical protein
MDKAANRLNYNALITTVIGMNEEMAEAVTGIVPLTHNNSPFSGHSIY